MLTVSNPIIPGFNPDPSILRIDDDYYILTSTFEWYPGLSLYHSTDLVNWELIGRPLNRLSQLDMRGCPDSCGVWAPCLSYHDGTFYIAFTYVKRFAGDFKDSHNYFISASDIRGVWSEPVYVNSSGFDPSIFHDGERAYFLNMLWDHQPIRNPNETRPQKYFGGIMMQEIDLRTGQLLGKARNIFLGSSVGLTEGPHLYKRDDWYYLLVAEGGTGNNHSATFARSRELWGPYVEDPNGSMLTAANSPNVKLKRAGHGDLVETKDGAFYLVHLCSRPLWYRGRSVMGRETSIQPVEWQKSGWPKLKGGGINPLDSFQVKSAQASNPKAIKQEVYFDGNGLPLDFQTLRYPLPEEVMSVKKRQGYLRLTGKESLGSWFEQALVARRQQAFCFSAETAVDFYPKCFQHMAGLVCYYNSQKYIYLQITLDEDGNRVLDLSVCANSWHTTHLLAEPVPLPSKGEIRLKVVVEYDVAYFYYAVGNSNWNKLPDPVDYSVLSDEVGGGGADANFTGSFVGICCQDLREQTNPADFAYFFYSELD